MNTRIYDRLVYLQQQLSHHHKETHQVARIWGEDAISEILARHVVRCGLHCWRNNVARRVHQQLGEPLEHLLNLLRIGLLKVRDGEVDANVADA